MLVVYPKAQLLHISNLQALGWGGGRTERNGLAGAGGRKKKFTYYQLESEKANRKAHTRGSLFIKFSVEPTFRARQVTIKATKA